MPRFRPATRRGAALAALCLAAAAAAPSVVSAAPSAIVIISAGGATAGRPAVRLQPPAPPTQPGQTGTLPPGSALPSEATCAARVVPSGERRPINAVLNQTVGTVSSSGPAPVVGQPITGNFRGTTDEIIQWAACKWGIDVDVVRAQVAKESWWHQDRANSSGDLTTNQSMCAPSLRTASGPCPDSIGLGQVRYSAHQAAFANDNAIRSSAYNLDYTYSVWRSCFEGQLTWLNQFERGGQYAAGDLWGCTGVWFSGRWHTADAETYIGAVQALLASRAWESPAFQNG